ncbi:MAG TPA: DUF2911 domain-containing protein [Membranihabitans sp.]|nr:DUF2911 domain-containing protein [Membranihabitans sp.]
MHKLIKLLFAGMLGLLMVTGLYAQNQEPASPPKEASGKIGDAMITINYSSPGVKGRTIWGDLVPYDQVWRAGANEATKFKTDKDLMIEGQELQAGTYSLFLIPRENGPTTVIFNTVAEQWGSYNYDESKDALRVDVEPAENSMTERLEYSVGNDGIVIAWENYKLPISVSVK